MSKVISSKRLWLSGAEREREGHSHGSLGQTQSFSFELKARKKTEKKKKKKTIEKKKKRRHHAGKKKFGERAST